MGTRVWPGQPFPLGASYDGAGTKFALYSEVAERVELCLFNNRGEETRVDLPESDGYIWHGYLPDLGAGTRYGFRVHGPWDPRAGLRCDPSKLLLDPYAKAIDGQVQWNEAVFSYPFDNPEGEPNRLNSAPYVPKAVVVTPYCDWANDHSPRIPLHETVIYEAHVKGFTMRHPDIPPQ